MTDRREKIRLAILLSMSVILCLAVYGLAVFKSTYELTENTTIAPTAAPLTTTRKSRFKKKLADVLFRSLDSLAKYAIRALRVLSLRRQSDIVARIRHAVQKLESGRLADARFRRARNLWRSSSLQFDSRFNSCHKYLYGCCCRQVLKMSQIMTKIS